MAVELMTPDKKKQINKTTNSLLETVSDGEESFESIATKKKPPLKLLKKYYIILIAIIGLLILIIHQNPNFKVDWNNLLASFYGVLEKSFDIGRNSNDDIESGILVKNDQKVTIREKLNTSLSREILTLKITVGSLEQKVLELESHNKLMAEFNSAHKRDEKMYEGKAIQQKRGEKERQKNLEKTITSLVDRFAVLESKGNDKLTNIGDLEKILKNQEFFKAEINNRIDLLRKIIDTQVSKHPNSLESSSLMIFSVSQIAGAVLQNKPFHIHLESLRLIAAKNTKVEKHIKQLAKHSKKGVISYNALGKSIKSIQENLLATRNLLNQDLIGGAFSQIKSLVKIRKITDLEESSLELTLASAYGHLQNNNLRLAIKIISHSSDRLNDDLKKWLSQATARLLVEEAVSNLQAVALSNLSSRE